MIEIVQVKEEGVQLEHIRQLFLAYAQELGEDLCFQGFEAEMQQPLKKYGPPAGVLYLASLGEEVAGCIALMPLSEAGTCEMKRLYVRPHLRRNKIGDLLVAQLLHTARELQYHTMKLDTLTRLEAAIALYRRYGFEETTAYYKNPLPGVVYMEKQLQQ
jgi:ribosomal protein S18 acetylase RimI-like enzyme